MKQADSEAQGERQLAAALKSAPEIWTPDCLPPERMLALAEGTVPEAEAVSLLAHVALCARCRREYVETGELIQLAEEVGALKAQAATRSAAAVDTAQAQNGAAPAAETRKPSFRAAWSRLFSPGLGFALGAAAASIALFYVWTLQRDVQRADQDRKLASVRKERDTQRALTERSEQENRDLRQELTALKSGQDDASRLATEVGRLQFQVKSQRIQVARLTEAETALQQMPLPAPTWMRPQESGQSRGGGTDSQSPPIVLVHPVNEALEDSTPILECRPLPGATDYQISLNMEGSNDEIPAPRPLAATRWQATTPLSPGKVYQWSVTAQRGTARLHSPIVKFSVLSEAEKREVEAARRKFARSPLTLGVLYARMGMLAKAEEQFRSVLKSDPNHAIAQRWLSEIEALHSRPYKE
jgi:hypothetical protein